MLAQLVQLGATPLSVLKVVHWSAPSPRSVFFWQVFFVELLCAPSAAQRAACAPLREPPNAELRDGVLLFLERHVRKMVAKQQPALQKALRALVRFVEEGA